MSIIQFVKINFYIFDETNVEKMRIHLIAIGGSAMHNLAIALKNNGHTVTGSDDEIFEPSRSRLQNYNLLPKEIGWHPENIDDSIDVIILGMHARVDNPELKKAQELNLKVYSYPEYLYEQCKNKKRIVIAGSHGKTTVTSMIMHAMRNQNIEFDYMVGAQLQGFDTMVNLSDTSEIAIFEGDEYLSSPIDRRPKFLWYKPHFAVITGVAWDHINVFPTIEEYNEQFLLFIKTIEPNGYLTWYENDKILNNIVSENKNIDTQSYKSLSFKMKDDESIILFNNKEYKVPVFGEHNFQNMSAALNICKQIGIEEDAFLTSMQTFEGAARRMEILRNDKERRVYYDFAHAPSKVKAAVNAVREREKENKITALLELHTFSSLNSKFLPQYRDALKEADFPFVYFNPAVLEHKKLPAIRKEEVSEAFNINVKNILTDSQKAVEIIKQSPENSSLLIMTSGNFNGVNLKELVK